MKNKINSSILFIYISICWGFPVKDWGMACIEGDCYNGKGTIIYANQEIYSGEFKDGNKHGYGIFVYGPTGSERINQLYEEEIRPLIKLTENHYGKYEGDYEEDMKWGFGTYTFPGGQFYTGQYKRDKRHGIGMLVYADKTNKYIGEFRRGKQDGWGINHKIIPQSKNDDLPIMNMLLDISSMHFIKNDSLNIIESGAFLGEQKEFKEPLDSVIIYLFNNYT